MRPWNSPSLHLLPCSLLKRLPPSQSLFPLCLLLCPQRLSYEPLPVLPPCRASRTVCSPLKMTTAYTSPTEASPTPWRSEISPTRYGCTWVKGESGGQEKPNNPPSGRRGRCQISSPVPPRTENSSLGCLICWGPVLQRLASSVTHSMWVAGG